MRKGLAVCSEHDCEPLLLKEAKRDACVFDCTGYGVSPFRRGRWHFNTQTPGEAENQQYRSVERMIKSQPRHSEQARKEQR